MSLTASSSGPQVPLPLPRFLSQALRQRRLREPHNSSRNRILHPSLSAAELQIGLMRENILNIRRDSRTGSQLLSFKLPFWISSLVCAHPSRFQARGLALGSLTKSEPNPGVSMTRQVLWSSRVAPLATQKARKFTLATFI